MVISQNAKNITLSAKVFPEISQFWLDVRENNPHKVNRTFTGYINDIVIQFLERYQFLKDTYPDFELVSSSKRELIIKDSKNDQIVQINSADDEKLFCKNCKSINCEHVIYSYQLPESITLRKRVKLM